jgi:ribosomal protein S18 acetylase RimI-like enzyme
MTDEETESPSSRQALYLVTIIAYVLQDTMEYNTVLKPAFSIFYHALEPRHIQFYRLMRLRALTDSPSVFGSTFQREIAFSPQVWTQRLMNPHQITFIATTSSSVDLIELPADCETWNQPCQLKVTDQSLPLGVITCIQSFDNPEDARIVGFWVSPEARRQGIGKALIEKALDWANQRVEEQERFKSVVLGVCKDNWAARGLYEKCGFTRAGTGPEEAQEILYTYKVV